MRKGAQPYDDLLRWLAIDDRYPIIGNVLPEFDSAEGVVESFLAHQETFYEPTAGASQYGDIDHCNSMVRWRPTRVKREHDPNLIEHRVTAYASQDFLEHAERHIVTHAQPSLDQRINERVPPIMRDFLDLRPPPPPKPTPQPRPARQCFPYDPANEHMPCMTGADLERRIQYLHDRQKAEREANARSERQETLARFVLGQLFP